MCEGLTKKNSSSKELDVLDSGVRILSLKWNNFRTYGQIKEPHLFKFSISTIFHRVHNALSAFETFEMRRIVTHYITVGELCSIVPALGKLATAILGEYLHQLV